MPAFSASVARCPQYRLFILDRVLKEQFQAAGAVMIAGLKARGNTMTAQQQAASSVLLDIDVDEMQALVVDSVVVLAWAQPSLLIEWTVALALWDLVRRWCLDQGVCPCQVTQCVAVLH